MKHCNLAVALRAAFFIVSLAPLASAETDFFSTGPATGTPDSLCDVWQYKYNAWGLTPSSDDDDDGCSNLVESVAGTDPRNPDDCIKIGGLTLAGNSIIFAFHAEAGKRYAVVSSPSPSGPTWTEESGAVIPANENGAQTIVVSKPPSVRKYYRLETKDVDSDGDGASDWAEREMGTNPGLANSPNNASGGTASDGATLASLLSLTAVPAPGEDIGYERTDRTATTPVSTPAKVHLVRSQGTMQLTLPTSGIGAPPTSTKGGASGGDYSLPPTVTIPMGAGTPGSPYVVSVNPVQDAAQEVPEYLEVSFELPGVPQATGPSATVSIVESDPSLAQNRRLYVAYLGREAGAVTTASGIATALVDGDNNTASVALTFSNLSSLQNTAYIRINADQDVRFLGLGQVSGVSWPIRAAHTKITDQAMLDGLAAGQVYVDITTENYPDGEIFGYFGNAVGSTEFDPDSPSLEAPGFGDPEFTTAGNDPIERDIWRFMGQSTFGGTTALYNQIRAKVDTAIGGGGTYLDGLEDWLDEQMSPAQTPTVNYMKLVMAADNEEFMLRGNKPITFGSDPQFNGAAYNVTYDANGVPTISSTADNNRAVNNYPQSGPNRRREWWSMILQAPDQVRQRMALALSEILVISEADQTILDRHYGCANFWDMLAAGAFGKYRTLLEQVTYSPMMGIYLSHMSNRATYDAGGGLIVSPDENYAREIMQLFSIGLVLRHPDGSLVLDEAGLPIPTYDQTDITELARVMTGWSHGARNAISWVSQWNTTTLTWNHQSSQRVGSNVLFNGASANSQWFGRDDGHLFFPTPWINPMKLVGRIGTTVYHDFNQYNDPGTGLPVSGVSKRLMAGKHGQYDIPMRTGLPSGTTYAEDVQYHNAAALDMTEAHNALAGDPTQAAYGTGSQASPGHQNTPVNISRWLIQRLVTSNPSNGYIYRVQKRYRDSNGNLGEVLKAILLDYEARSLQLADSSISHGKVKEPLVAFTSMLRAMRAFSGAPVSILKDNPPPFSASDSPLAGAYPATELAKFSTENVNPPSLPAGWAQGPFRYRFNDLTGSIGQSPQRAPSVFNWFMPDYVKPGAMAEAGLFAPELQISTESNDVAKVNFFYSYTLSTPVGFSTQPGSDAAISDFVLSNNSATGAAFFSVNGQVSSSLTFNSSNWNTPQTVTITAVNNGSLGNLSNGLLRFNVTGAGTGYDGITQAPETITILDDEKPNETILVSNSSFSTWIQEGGNTDTVDVRLSAPPSANVTITPTLSGQATVSPASLTFTPGNWSTSQAFTLTAVNDATSELAGTANDTLVLTSASSAANFNGLTASLPVNVVDNDDGTSSHGIIITESSGGTSVDEASGSDTYQVRLSKAPSTGTVTVRATAGAGLYMNTTGTSLTQDITFTSADWSTNKTFTVRANNDTTPEGSYPASPVHIARITHAITANVGGYTTTLPIQTLGVPITDNDERIMMVHSGGETRVSEDGTLTDTFTLRLRTAPTAGINVTVSLASNTVSCDPPFLVFNSTNYTIPQTVTVRANDDGEKQGLRSAWNEGVVPLNATATSTITSGAVTGLTMTNVGAGYTSQPRVTFSGGGGSGANAYALLSAQGTITGLQVVSAGTGYTSAPTVTIDPPPYGGGVIIATATSDNSADGNYNNYWSYTHSALKVSILDNDLKDLLITQTGGSTEVGENGVTDTYTLALTSPPSADVTVAVNPAANTGIPPVAQLRTSPASVTFTPANWNTPQIVTVTGDNDATVEGDHTSVIYHTLQSTDKAYAGLQTTPLTVSVVDNDNLPLTITHLDGYTAVAEGGPAFSGTVTSGWIHMGDSFRVRLPVAPSANVTVNLVSESSQITVSPSTLTFTNANGTTDQTVTVTAVDDAVSEANPHQTAIRFQISSTDTRFNNPPNDPVIIPISDNDTPGFILGETDGGTNVTLPFGGSTRPTETGTDTFTVLLNKAPTSDVVINVASSNTAELTVSPATLTFTAANWSTRQTVTVTAIGDQTVETREPVNVTLGVNDATSDDSFDPAPDQVLPVWIFDNPRRNESLVTIETGGDSWVAEGGKTDSLQFYLSKRPDMNVAVSIDSNAQLSVDKNTFVFTPANWNIPQTVQVSAIDDTAIENNHNVNLQFRCNALPQGTLLPGDARWTFVNPATRFDIVDNDGIGVIIDESGGDTRITEGGATDTYTVRLSQAPTGNVVVNCSTSNSSAGQTVSPTTVTFTTANWNQPQTVTVTATDDTSIEGYTTTIHDGANTHTYNVNHSINTGLTADAAYDALTGMQSIVTFITDNDVRIITRHAGLDTRVHEDGGAGDIYDVVLSSAPTANVTVNVSVPSGQGFTATPATLVFTPADWSTPQSVTVSGVDNALNDRYHAWDLAHTSTSADTNFNAQTIPSIRVHVMATDVPQILMYEGGSTTLLSEGGSTDDYYIGLSHAPTSDVNVTVTTDSQLEAGLVAAYGQVQTYSSSFTLTFTPADWMVKRVLMRAVDDLAAETTPHLGYLSHTASSADTRFNGITVAGIPAFITDNDYPAVRVMPSGGTTNLTEAGATDTYNVHLTRQPASDVAITIAPGAQTSISSPGSTLTFTNSNWNLPQTVTLAAVNDTTIEGNHSATVTHTAASADPLYNGIGAPSITASITDNDGPQLVIAHSGGSTTVTEGNSTDTFTIQLNQAPTGAGDVTVTLVPPVYIIPTPPYARQVGYYTSNLGGSNQNRERVVLDFHETIQLYRDAFYDHLETVYGSGLVPGSPADADLQNAHWAASKALIDKLDLWFAGGSLKARHPVLIEPNQPLPDPLPALNPRQAILEAIYYLNGGNNNLSTTRYEPEITFDPKNPPNTTFANEVRDRARWAAYLMSTVMPAFVAH